MTTATANRTTVTRTAQAASPEIRRFDIYAPIHKALRNFMSDTLLRVGRLDVDDADECERSLGQVDALLDFCAQHMEHENEFVHTAIGARLPAGAARTADDHVEHSECIDGLRDELRSLRAARGEQRERLALRLYRHLALFVAENFRHMHIEETVNNAALWAHYTDEEIVELHHRLLASIPPRGHLEVARWMIAALAPSERTVVLGEMQREAPPEAFRAVIELVRPHLDASGLTKLGRAIGVAG